MRARTQTTNKTSAAAPKAPARKTASKTIAAKSAPAKRPAAKAPRTLEEFMLQAYILECDAHDRYTEFADAMETHNNREVAALFRKMAEYEAKHAQEILEQMGWKQPPPIGSLRWPGFESPEAASIDAVHYLMQPWHALQIALAAEQRAEAFFGELVRAATSEAVRKAARELQAEEREHVELVRAWLKKVPKPERDWAVDPDPPRYSDL